VKVTAGNQCLFNMQGSGDGPIGPKHMINIVPNDYFLYCMVLTTPLLI
jgi:hypothetical protein